MTPLSEILLTAALGTLGVLLALTTLLGAAVAVRPALLERLRRRAERRYSLRRATRALDVPRNADRWFYRHHRVYGAVVVVLAAFLLWFLALGPESADWRRLFAPRYRELAGLFADSARFLLWLVAVFAVVIGTVVFVRPSALKALEARANRWITARRVTRGLDRERDALDEWLARRPRAWGIIAALASAACLAALLVQWQASGLAG